ncbi:MAG: carboxypeptidase regulatory-like domain-containing protein [Gemmatimonadota bacterium]
MSGRLIGAGVVVLLLGVGIVRVEVAAGDPLVEGRHAPARAAAGSVEGTVRLDIATEAAPPMLSPYARRRYRPPSAAPAAGSSPRDVVVYVLTDRQSPPERNSGFTITQRDRTIIPYVAAVPVGTSVRFPNEDDVFHNLFSLSGPHPFNLGRYAPGESKSETFSKPGVVHLFCDIHSEMSGVILVLDTPHIARPDELGRYRISGLPEGRHRLIAWHESAGADTIAITVRAGGVAQANFRLPS